MPLWQTDNYSFSIEVSIEMSNNTDSGKYGLLIHQKNEATITILNRCSDKDMTPLPLTGNLRLPKSVLELIELLKPNSKGVFDLNGNIYVEMSMAVLQSADTFEAFLVFYRSTIAKFPGLKPYTSLYEKTTYIPSAITADRVPDAIGTRRLTEKDKFDITHNMVTSNIYIQIKVMDLMLEKLIYFFGADKDFPVGNAINFLLEHGLSDSDLQNEIGVPYRTYHRYKTKNNDSAKMAEQPAAQTEQSKQTSNLAVS